jgi:hypothetical protein
MSNVGKIEHAKTPAAFLRMLADAIDSARTEGKHEPDYFVVGTLDVGKITSKAFSNENAPYLLLGQVETQKALMIQDLME